LACGPRRAGGASGRRGQESDSALSPARPWVGDDRRGPPVIGCGAGEGGGRGLAELGRAGLVSWAATRRARTRGVASWAARSWAAGAMLGC
jgi:hypothetical protein